MATPISFVNTVARGTGPHLLGHGSNNAQALPSMKNPQVVETVRCSSSLYRDCWVAPALMFTPAVDAYTAIDWTGFAVATDGSLAIEYQVIDWAVGV